MKNVSIQYYNYFVKNNLSSLNILEMLWQLYENRKLLNTVVV